GQGLAQLGELVDALAHVGREAEQRHAAGAQRAHLPRAGVAGGTRLALLGVEGPEAADLDHLPGLEKVRDDLHELLDHSPRFHLRTAAGARDFLDKVLLGHVLQSGLLPNMLCRTGIKVTTGSVSRGRIRNFFGGPSPPAVLSPVVLRGRSPGRSATPRPGKGVAVRPGMGDEAPTN